MNMSDQPAKAFPWADHWPEIDDQRVRSAFAVVPRQRFVSERLALLADQDAPLPIGEGQTISQPFVVALMVQALALKPGDKVLEIGIGSGFQTAILCELTASDADPCDADTRGADTRGVTVYAIERFESLAKNAAAVLADLGYTPHLRIGDGAYGWPEAAPFDAIVVSAVAPHVPRPLWEQLGDGGRMVMPVGQYEEDQQLWLVRKLDGQMLIERMGGVRFVPMISPLFDDPAQWAEQ